MTMKGTPLKGREVPTGTSTPEPDVLDGLTKDEWRTMWEDPSGSYDDLLPHSPPEILQELFGVDSYEEAMK